MTPSARPAFAKPAFLPVRATPKGFLIGQLPIPAAVIEGCVTKSTALRTRFERGRIVCSSNDGDHSVRGALCVECLHPKCRLQLRIHLRDSACLYVLHLNVPSAGNLFDLEDEARHNGEDFWKWRLRLSILNHDDRWAEVKFQRLY